MVFTLRTPVVPMIRKSDIDQLVVGYVAEERYFRTRNQLFEESPNLPEKLPILSIFGDISSENRLQRILEEYVQFKTKQLVPICAVCDQCQSLADLWKIFDRVVEKIKNYKPSDPSPQTGPAEMQRYSPSHIWQPSSRSRSTKAGNQRESAETHQRKELNPLSNRFESVPTNVTTSTSSSTRRKKTSVPRKLKLPPASEVQPLYAHNGDLSKLLHTSDKDDALALVGVKILSNMKKCAGKGGMYGLNMENSNDAFGMCTENASTLFPPKQPLGSALDIDDLVSDETREGLVEMTIDSLLNPGIKDTTENASHSDQKFDEEFSELRKLLEFDADNSSELNLPDVIQSKQDERVLMEIIKADDELELPENPTPMDYDSAVFDTSLRIYEHLEDEKNTVVGLMDIESSQFNDSLAHVVVTPTVEACPPITQESNLPTITNVRSEVPSHSDLHIASTGGSPVQENTLKKMIEIRSTQDHVTENETTPACAPMPPKKRFLAKETSTPEKIPGCGAITGFMSPHKKRSGFVENVENNSALLKPPPSIVDSCQNEGNISDNLSTPVANFETTQLFPTSTGVDLGNTVEATESVSVPTINGNDCTKAVGNSKENTIEHRNLIEIANVLDPKLQVKSRNSERKHKPNTAIKDLFGKKRNLQSNLKKIAADTSGKSGKKTSAASKGNSYQSPSKLVKASRIPASPKVRVLNPGEGPVVINLKDKGRMPIHVQGIVVRPKNDKHVSKEDIIDQLIDHMHKTSGGSVTPSSQPVVILPQEKSLSSTVQASPQISVPPIAGIAPIEILHEEIGVNNFQDFHSMHENERPAYKEGNVELIQTPQNVELRPHGTDRHTTTLSNTASSMPYGLINKKNTTPGMFNTPQKLLDSPNQFSTISPSAGIFSVMGRGTDIVLPSHSKTSQLTSVKSNLLQTFTDEGHGHDARSYDREVLNRSCPADEQSQHSTNGNLKSVLPLHGGSSSRAVDPEISSALLLPISGLQSGIGARRNNPDAPRALNKALKQEKNVEKRALKKKRGSGIHMCNKMKKMVRIEPKRRGVPAVRRYFVETAQNKRNSDKPTSDTLTYEPKTVLRPKEMELDVGNHLIQTYTVNRAGWMSKENTIYTSHSPSAVLPKHHSTIESTSVAKKKIDYLNEENSEKSENTGTGSNGKKKQISDNVPHEKQEFDAMDVACGSISSKKITLSGLSSTSPKTEVSFKPAEGTCELIEEQSQTGSPSHGVSRSEKKLKRKGKRNSLHEKKAKLVVTERSPVMKWTYKEIQAKLDAIHGEKNEERKQTDYDSKRKEKKFMPESDTKTKSPHPVKELKTHKSVKSKTADFSPKDSRNSDSNVSRASTPSKVHKKEYSDALLKNPSIDAVVLGPTVSYNELKTLRNDKKHAATESRKMKKECIDVTETEDLSCTTSPSKSRNHKTANKSSPEKRDVKLNSERNVVPCQREESSPGLLRDENSSSSKIEPLDLSLSSWTNSKSHQDSNISLQKESQLSIPSGKRHFERSGSELKPLREVPAGNIKQRKAHRKGRSSGKIGKLEKKIKKVNLKNLDISKFLASIDYNKVS